MQITVPFSSYPKLRFLAVIAGLLGTFQALAWMGMSIVGILAYYGHIDFEGAGPNYGYLLRFTLFEMYFHGDNTPSGFPNINFDMISELDLMEPWIVNIWMWVIASLSLLWLFASVALLTNVKKSNLRFLNVFLYIWIIITFVIVIIDLVLFVLFILDYIKIMHFSYDIQLNFTPQIASVLITAQNAAGIMASVALRGYFLWFVNLFLVFSLFIQTFHVYDYNKITHHEDEAAKHQNGQINPAFINNDNEEMRGHSIFHNQPIQAFNDQPGAPWYNYLTKDIPRVHRHSQFPPPLIRSNSDTNLDTRNIQSRQSSVESDVVLRREQVQQELKYRQSHSLGSSFGGNPSTASAFEQRPPLKSAMRHSRYQ